MRLLEHKDAQASDLCVNTARRLTGVNKVSPCERLSVCFVPSGILWRHCCTKEYCVFICSVIYGSKVNLSSVCAINVQLDFVFRKSIFTSGQTVFVSDAFDAIYLLVSLFWFKLRCAGLLLLFPAPFSICVCPRPHHLCRPCPCPTRQGVCVCVCTLVTPQWPLRHWPESLMSPFHMAFEEKWHRVSVRDGVLGLRALKNLQPTDRLWGEDASGSWILWTVCKDDLFFAFCYAARLRRGKRGLCGRASVQMRVCIPTLVYSQRVSCLEPGDVAPLSFTEVSFFDDSRSPLLLMHKYLHCFCFSS